MKISASYHQERLWFIDTFETGYIYTSRPVYHNIPLIFEVIGPLDTGLLERSIKDVIQRHEGLRTRIVTEDDKPYQLIDSSGSFNLTVMDLPVEIEEGNDEAAVNFCLEKNREPFLLDGESLIRGTLLRFKEDKALVAIAIHHIISDKLSLEILLREIALYYEIYIAGRPPGLPELPIHYADFSQWQQELSDAEIEPLFLYWKRKLGNKPQALELPTDYPRAAVHTYQMGKQSFTFTLPANVKGDFAVLLAAFKILLHRYSGLNDIIVGTSAGNRVQPGTESIIGPLANLVALRSFLAGKYNFKKVVSRLEETVKDAFKYGELPFDKLVLLLNPGKDMSRTALFDVLFQYEEKPLKTLEIDALTINVIETNLGWGKYDLNLLIQGGEECFSGVLVYNKDYYRDTTISRLIGHYKVLLESVCRNPNMEISKLPVLTEAEQRQLLEDWNQTRADYPADKTIHGLFEEQAEKTPDGIALCIEETDTALTYNVLNRQANRLARYLRSKYGIKPETIIAVMMKPSPEMMTAVLGILKAGGAYLPIDPEHPVTRIVSILEDSGVSLLVTANSGIDGKSFTFLKGIPVVKRQPVVTAKRPQIIHLDGLPIPDRSYVDYKKYSRYIGYGKVKNCISIQGTRGCPYKCAYCHKIWPKKHVYRSAENLYAEVKLYYDLGIRRFAIIDDIFNINVRNSSRFYELVIKNGLDVLFFFPTGIRGDVLREDYIDLMVEAGVIDFAVALESASPRLQKLMGKNLDIEKLRRNICYICKKYPQIILELFTMHGFPSETEEEAMATLEFIKRQKWLHFPYINILRIYLNTDMERIAIEHGIPRQAIVEADTLSQHDFSNTLPFDKGFTKSYQSEFLNEYFLSRERLMHVLPHQMKVFTRDELAQRYDSYLPIDIHRFEDFLDFAGMKEEELDIKPGEPLDEKSIEVPNLDEKIKSRFPVKAAAPDALRLLLLDLSQFFRAESSHMLYDVHEPPLGPIALMSYLDREFGPRLRGKIVKSRIDFDNFAQLKALIEEFNPDIIGIRSLTFYKEFFHRTVEMLRVWGIDAPVIAGGPYATSDYATILQDRNITLVVMGEGELTFAELIGKILENGGRMPGEEVLKDIAGLAFIPAEQRWYQNDTREIVPVEEIADMLAAEPGLDLEAVNQPSDLAYVIYTSGSTGKPKGCMVSHRNVVRLMKSDRFPFDFNRRDTWIMAHSFCFDFSVWEMYGALLYGGRLIVPCREDVRDVSRFLFNVKKHNVSVLNQTPAAFYNLAAEEKKSGENQNKGSLAKHLRYVIFGGDKLQPVYLQEWWDEYSLRDIRLINMYGITETTVHVTFYSLTADDIKNTGQRSPIGSALPETTIYIFNESMSLQPPGVSGELYVGGSGVCKGYLNRIKLTRKRFMVNPYKPGELLYKTGDLGRWLAGGNIEYLGRSDHQVKIRGFRIEPGEIENRLLGYKDIKEAVVIARELVGGNKLGDNSGEKHLCAYLVSDNELTISQLRDYLSRELPPYMIPSYFVQLPQLPVTDNGKIDRKSLPEPLGIGLESGIEYEAPRTEVEKQLVEIWQNVLGRKVVGIKENFFMIGGDSIKSVQIVSRLIKSGHKVEMRDIFQYPTIAELAPHVIKKEQTVDQSPVSGPVPLTPLQRWFLAGDFPGSHHFNQAVMLYWQEGIEEEAVRAIFKKIQEHHDALRITFGKDEEGNAIQVDHDLQYPISLQKYDFRRWTDKKEVREVLMAKANEIQAGIDLEKGPLMKLGLFHMDDGDRLLVVIHHLVVDGVSWRILFEDLETLYRQYQQGKPFELPLKTESFKSWSEKLSRYAISESVISEIPYWQKLESGVASTTKIEKDFAVEENYLVDTGIFSFQLEESETEALLTMVNRAFGTEINEILLTALGLAVRENFALQHLLIALEGHGREEIIDDVDISRTVGWFTCIYPVLLDVSFYREGDDNSLARQVKEVKENLRRIPNKGACYGILKYLTPPESRGIGFRLKPQIIFNYLGQFDADLQQTTFKIAGESAGNIQSLEIPREYELEITGIIANKRLKISIVYNNNQYKPGTIEGLRNSYHRELSRIIAYCSARQARELTPSDFIDSTLSIESLELLKAKYSLEDICPLTPMQEGMLFHALLAPSSSAYLQQMSYRLQGELKKDIIEKALNELFKRYDILRTIFIHEGFGLDHPIQVIINERRGDFLYEDLREMDKPGREVYISEFKEKDRNRPFNLAGDVLMRITLFRLAQWEYEFNWSFHHILMDGWCIGIIVSEFLEIYQCFIQNIEPQLPAVKPYRSYIRWLQGQDKEKSRNYWARYLENYEEIAAVPRMKVIKTHDNEEYKQEQVSFLLEEGQKVKLHELAAKYQVTLNTIFETIWGVILGNYSGKQDVVFGTVVSGRPPAIEEVESMVGLFINTVPVRIRIYRKKTIGELLQRVRDEAVDSEPHHYFPLVEIQAGSALKQNLLDHIFVFENYPVAEQVKSSGAAWEISNAAMFEQTDYDLNVYINPGARMAAFLRYNAAVYDGRMMQQLADRYKQAIHRFLEDKKPGIPVDELTALADEEKRQILISFNDTENNYPREKTLHRVFEEKANCQPARIALEFNRHQLTYGQLNEAANRLAHRLRKGGVTADTVVCIMAENSFCMLIGIFGILKAGGAYLPLDPDYPAARVKYILEDSASRFMLTRGQYLSRLERIGDVEIINLDVADSYLCEKEPINYTGTNQIENLAYVIYTSGSTGNPKGVMVKHRSVVNILWALDKYYPFEASDVYLLKTSYLFDVSVTELFGWIFAGGRLAILDPGDEKDPEKILDAFKRYHVTHVNFVPSMFKAFIDYIKDEYIDLDCDLKYIFLAGEAIPPEALVKFKELDLSTPICLENIYGPTEATIYASRYSLSHWAVGGSIPIGKPVQNTQLYILDKNNRLLPIGASGELCIGGAGLARGYLNRPELTAEKFDLDLWDSRDEEENETGERVYCKSSRSYSLYFSKKIYKTGDLARWLPDGNIEFLGRMDHQVKIRGFRVEPGEIETYLEEIDGIHEAVVIERNIMGESSNAENTDTYLCAYIVASGTINKSQIRNDLTQRLPYYMVPAHFIQLDEIPLNTSGKINRKALPDPGLTAGAEYTAPQNEIQRKLVKIWADVLSLSEESVSIDANFFELGGHSLTAITLITKIHKEINAKLRLNEIFAMPTVAQMARHLGAVKKQAYIPIEVVEQKEYYPLSSTQRRMFVLQQIDPHSTNYNIPHLLSLGDQVNREKLGNAFNKLVERHEILRTSIGIINQEPVQIICPEVEFSLQYYETVEWGSDADNPCREDLLVPRRVDIEKASREILKKFVRPFDLSRPPFLRAALIHTGLFGNILAIDMHHIISDERTMEIIAREIHTFYNNEKLPPLKLQYKDYARWQNWLWEVGGDDDNESKRSILKQQEDYWLKKLKDPLPVLDIPGDYSRPEVQRFDGRYISFEIDREKTQAVIQLSISLNVTIYMILLAVYNIMLAKLSGQEDIIVGTPAAGRRHAELEPLVGMFINMLPMRNFPEMNKTFKKFLMEVKANALADIENQDYPFDELVEKLGIKRVPNRSPLFDAGFYFQTPKRSMIEIERSLDEDENELELEYELVFSDKDFEHNISYAELGLFSYQLKHRIKFELRYHTALFKQETVERMTQYYKNILEQVAANPGVKLSDLQLFSQEKHDIFACVDVSEDADINQSREKIEADFDF